MPEIPTQKLLSELQQIQARELVPESVYAAAHNPEMVEVQNLRVAEGELSVIVVEHNCVGLTDERQWSEWIHDREHAVQPDPAQIIFLPKAPEGVDRLHAVFRNDILAGRLSLTDRIVMTCKLRIKGDLEPILFVADFDGEIGVGIAREFYTKTLPLIAKKLGLRYISGQNKAANLSFFTERLGRYEYRQLKPEAKKILFPEIDPLSNQGLYRTIQFLYPEDVEKFVDV